MIVVLYHDIVPMNLSNKVYGPRSGEFSCTQIRNSQDFGRA